MRNKLIDSSICNSCQYYYSSVAGIAARCHYYGKHIYNGECIEYKPIEDPPSELELAYRAREEYEEEWN